MTSFMFKLFSLLMAMGFLCPASALAQDVNYEKWYRSIGNELYEVKTENNQEPNIVGGRFSSSAEQRVNILVHRDVFRSENWEIQLEFTINNIAVTVPQNDNGHPVFFTFSDDKNAGFLIIWPKSIEYYNLGPGPKKVKEWDIPDIAGHRMQMVLNKSGERLEVHLADVSQSLNMNSAALQPHNYEMPVSARQGKLPGPATRNFIRFGTIYYPWLNTYPELQIHSLKIVNYSE